MDDSQRLQLQQLIKTNNVEDQTGLIRELKHSVKLRNDVNSLLMIKQTYINDELRIQEESISQCSFLFMYYTDIYNKIKKDEINLEILFKFLDILEQIENNELDQHDGSFMVGTLLKELYIDSALKKADKLNKTNDNLIDSIKYIEPIQISWKQFKSMNRN
jgi:hypothetical protein